MRVPREGDTYITQPRTQQLSMRIGPTSTWHNEGMSAAASTPLAQGHWISLPSWHPSLLPRLTLPFPFKLLLYLPFPPCT